MLDAYQTKFNQCLPLHNIQYLGNIMMNQIAELISRIIIDIFQIMVPPKAQKIFENKLKAQGIKKS